MWVGTREYADAGPTPTDGGADGGRTYVCRSTLLMQCLASRAHYIDRFSVDGSHMVRPLVLESTEF